MTSGTASSLISTASGLSTTSVCSVIMTAVFGFVSATTNLRSPKPYAIMLSSIMVNTSSKNGDCDIAVRLLLVPPSEMMSPFTTALPSSPCLNMLAEALTTIPSLAGAIVTFLAGSTVAFLTAIISPMEVLAFFLESPSILIMFRPMSPGYALSTIAAVFLVPSISTMSPGLTSISLMKLLSILTIPLFTSS